MHLPRDWCRRWNAHWYCQWAAVQEHYHGIEVNPYRNEFRSAHDWYYEWDVDAGVVWHASTVSSIGSAPQVPGGQSTGAGLPFWQYVPTGQGVGCVVAGAHA